MSLTIPQLLGMVIDTTPRFPCSASHWLFGQIIRHGQYMMVYPSAFIPEAEKARIDHPRDYKLPGDEVSFKTADGVLLRCYLITRPNVRVLSFPANTRLR